MIVYFWMLLMGAVAAAGVYIIDAWHRRRLQEIADAREALRDYNRRGGTSIEDFRKDTGI